MSDKSNEFQSEEISRSEKVRSPEIIENGRKSGTPIITPQQLTIQDAFDPEDSVTVHLTVSNTSFWLADNDKKQLHPKKKTYQSKNTKNVNENSLPTLGFSKLFPLNKLANSNDSSSRNFSSSKLFKTNNFNFFSNNFLNLTLKQRPNMAPNSISATLNKNTNSNYIMDLSNKSYKNSIVRYKNTLIYDTKYMEYKKKWMEYLRKERKVFDSKWNSSVSVGNNNSKLEDYDLKKTLGNGSFGRVVLVKQKESGKYFALKVNINLIFKYIIFTINITHVYIIT